MLDDEQALAAIGELAPDEQYKAPKVARAGKLYKWCRDVMGRSVQPKPHIEMLGHLDSKLGNCTFSSGGNTQILAGFPRGTYKTTCLCIDASLYILKQNPNARILFLSHKVETARERLYQVKWEIDNNDTFHERAGGVDDWKPDFREDIWSNSSIVIRQRTKGFKEPSIGTAGLGASKTGSHYNVIFVDDAVTYENVQTGEGRNQVYEGLRNLIPILEPNGLIVHIFTRWHHDDAYGRILREEAERERRGEPLRFHTMVRGAYNDDGSLFFPAVFSHKVLEGIKEDRGPTYFAANYLNKPIADEDRTFLEKDNQISDFTFYSDSTSPNSGVVVDPYVGRIPVDITLAWDPAGIRASRRSNKHGITVVGTDPDSHWWVLEAEGVKGTPEQVIARVVQFIVHYRPRLVSCEDVQSQLLWLHLLDVELKRRKIHVPFHEFQTGGVPKSTRIELLQPRHARGEIHMRPAHTELIAQLRDYSAQFKEDHFDVLDSLVQHLEIAQPATGDIKQVSLFEENPEDPEYQDYVKRFGSPSKGYSFGKSATRWATR